MASILPDFVNHGLFRVRQFVFGAGPVLDRLTSEIEVVEKRHEGLKSGLAASGPVVNGRLAIAGGLLTEARKAAVGNKVNAGWKALMGARRELIALEDTQSLLLRATELSAECSEKLSGWRAAAAKKCLEPIDPKQAPPLPELVDRVTRAQELMDGHNDNVYFKQGYRQYQMLLLTWHLLFSLGSVLIVSFTGYPVPKASTWYSPDHAIETGSMSSLINEVDAFLEREAGTSPEEGVEEQPEQPEQPEPVASEGSETPAGGPPTAAAEPGETARGAAVAGQRPSRLQESDPLDLLLAVLLFGWVGGSFSALSSIAAAGGNKKIPEETMDSRVTLLRPLMGAGGAFIVYVGLLAGLPVSGFISNPAVLVFALAAGFSERFAVNVIERVASRG